MNRLTSSHFPEENHPVLTGNVMVVDAAAELVAAVERMIMKEFLAGHNEWRTFLITGELPDRKTMPEIPLATIFSKIRNILVGMSVLDDDIYKKQAACNGGDNHSTVMIGMVTNAAYLMGRQMRRNFYDSFDHVLDHDDPMLSIWKYQVMSWLYRLTEELVRIRSSCAIIKLNWVQGGRDNLSDTWTIAVSGG